MSARRRIVTYIVAFVCFGIGLSFGMTTAPAGRDNVSTAPLRGLWVVRHSLASPHLIDEVVDTAVSVGANALFVQVNGRMEAYYTSALLPPAEGLPANFDPLAYLLDRARDNDLHVHAWMNAFTAGMLVDTPAHPDHVLNRHREWVTYDRNGRSLWDYGWEEAQGHVPARMLDPGLPAVQRFVAQTVLEVVENYAIDGVHLDYIRYPSRRFGYHPESVARFEEQHGFGPPDVGDGAPAFVARFGRDEFSRRLRLWDEWRGAQVTELVRRIADGITARNERVLLSVAVTADVETTLGEHLQNWPGWVQHKFIDAVVPMAYSEDTATVARHIEAATRAAADEVPVYAGLGAYMLVGTPDALGAQIGAAREAGAGGIAVFSFDALREQPALADVLRRDWQ